MTIKQTSELARDLLAQQKRSIVRTKSVVEELALDLREVFSQHIVVGVTREDVKSLALEMGYALTEDQVTACLQDDSRSGSISDIISRIRGRIRLLGKKINPVSSQSPAPESEKKLGKGNRADIRYEK